MSKIKLTRSGGQIAGLYDLGETIGKGHFAVVKLAKHVFTGEKVAVKVIDKNKLDEISREHLFQEVNCMKLVQHPNVVRLYEVIDTQTKLYLILELGDGGDMYDYIMKHDDGLGEEMARKYFKQIVQAIHYCHKLHVVHRDLKPENVVFFEKLGIVKLTDFGFSNKFVPGLHLRTSCGSLAYSAPEILLGDSYNAPAVDVWSLGVILFMLVCGVPPFQEANDSETLTMILDCKYHVPSTVTGHCRDLIGMLLLRDPDQRAHLEDILEHPWLQGESEGDSVSLVPLISRADLTDEEHTYIVQKMIGGQIACKEEILQSLEKKDYNHITATYYLIAERVLKKKDELITANNNASNASSQRSRNDADGKPQLASLALSPRVKSAESLRNKSSSVDSLVSPPGNLPTRPVTRENSVERGFLMRRFSLIKEESLEEKDEDGVEHEFGLRHSKSNEESLSDDSDSRSYSSEHNESPSRLQPPKQRRSAPVRPLHSVRSSPQLLNQIFEEGESEDDGYLKPTQRTITHRTTVASPDMLRKYDKHRKRLTPTQQRSNTYSSSDTSDTDETDPTRRRKLKQRFHRRDSSENSSDTDGPATSGAGSRSRGSISGTSSARSTSSRKSEGKSSDGKQNKDSDSRKGSKENKYTCNGHSEVDALNEENKSCSLIHVRSKEFTDLMDKFSTNREVNELKCRHKRPRDKLKMDINRNGLMPMDAGNVPAVIKTKCCSVI